MAKIYATDPNDYNVPVTYSYNLRFLVNCPGGRSSRSAYVGNDTEDICWADKTASET